MSQRTWAVACALVAVVPTNLAIAEPNPLPGTDKQTATDSQAPTRAVQSDSPSAAEERIERVLDQKLRSPLDFAAVPLSQVADILRSEYDIPIQFDLPSMEEAATSPDVEVSLNLNNVTLRAALDLLMRQTGDLTYVIDNEVLQITTFDEAQQRLKVAVYRVDDLVRIDGSAAPQSADAYDFEPLVNILLSSVEKDSWEQNGTGEGEMHTYPPGMLVVSNTSRVHQQIARVLADMRRVKHEIEEAPASPAMAAPGPVTRGIPLVEQAAGGSDANRELVRKAILQSVDWGDAQSADSGERFLYVLPERVFVRHLPHVVRQVERVMAEMGAKDDRKPKRGGGGF